MYFQIKNILKATIITQLPNILYIFFATRKLQL
jgi:hypothetical protein